MEKEAGTLYVVGTPIGNLEDISFRAIKTLGEVDWVAAEDTRLTGRLLQRHGLEAHLISFYEHNEKHRVPELVRRLQEGFSGALVSSAGTPTVSDPGYRLVRAAVEEGIRVVPIPGPSAAISALSVSGLPTDSFVFIGFPPKKTAKLSDLLEELAASHRTLVFYESPNRILELLRLAEEILGDRPATLAREMTKVHEEFFRCPLSEIRARLSGRDAVRGECTLIVEGYRRSGEVADGDIKMAVSNAFLNGDASLSEVSRAVAGRLGVPRSRVYRIALALKQKAGDRRQKTENRTQ